MFKQKTLLSDYSPPSHEIPRVFLDLDLDEKKTLVRARLELIQNGAKDHCFFNAENMECKSVTVDGKAARYEQNKEGLTVFDMPKRCVLETVCEICPQDNSTLMGLYQSGSILCTQNEPQGFRRITPFCDRPDVMSTYTIKLNGRYPVLLANGNEVEAGKGYKVFEDPFPKPSYLVAMVAGDLGVIRDHFTTASKRNVALEIYCDKGNEERCWHAMRSLQKSMKWDEDTFGLEYDLDRFVIVAVDAFNFGAMENKGLNIFNSSRVLANEETATDDDFLRIEGVVAHEYFHNWTGDRVTLRDWFQLTLKEGLTVFRDQEFSSDMHVRSVKRIADICELRTRQFAEDASPNAHPIKPKSYLEIDNFYTATVYEKGAEVIRMLETLIGKKAFRKGMDEYFRRYDGKAVCTEDFVSAMEAGSGKDLMAFKAWYDQVGTARLRVKKEDEALIITQEARFDHGKQLPLILPLRFAIFSNDGCKEYALEMREKELRVAVSEGICSMNRGFAAPVIVEMPQALQERCFLVAKESDPIARYDALQSVLRELPPSSDELLDAMKSLFSADPAYAALALALPSYQELFAPLATVDIDAIIAKRKALKKAIGQGLYDLWKKTYHKLAGKGSYSLDPVSVGKRAFRGVCLDYLCAANPEEGLSFAVAQYHAATNMTERFFALTQLSRSDDSKREAVLSDFYQRFSNDKLVMAKYLSLCAQRSSIAVFDDLIRLEKDPVFSLRIPNLVRGLWGSLCSNVDAFHRADGLGYETIRERISQIDAVNPFVASILCKQFQLYPKLDKNRQAQMKKALTTLLAKKSLSPNALEIVQKTLGE